MLIERELGLTVAKQAHARMKLMDNFIFLCLDQLRKVIDNFGARNVGLYSC